MKTNFGIEAGPYHLAGIGHSGCGDFKEACYIPKASGQQTFSGELFMQYNNGGHSYGSQRLTYQEGDQKFNNGCLNAFSIGTVAPSFGIGHPQDYIPPRHGPPASSLYRKPVTPPYSSFVPPPISAPANSHNSFSVCSGKTSSRSSRSSRSSKPSTASGTLNPTQISWWLTQHLDGWHLILRYAMFLGHILVMKALFPDPTDTLVRDLITEATKWFAVKKGYEPEKGEQ